MKVVHKQQLIMSYLIKHLGYMLAECAGLKAATQCSAAVSKFGINQVDSNLNNCDVFL